MALYRNCVVPMCESTTHKCPNKLFIHVPKCPRMRKQWLELAGRNPKSLSAKSAIFFCEDHFDLPNDMENYTQYRIMGSVSQKRMKPNCLPSKFECQPENKKRSASSLSPISKKQCNDATHNKPPQESQIPTLGMICKRNKESPRSGIIEIGGENVNDACDYQLELKDFTPVKILNNNTNRKTVCIQGTYKDKSGVVLVLLEKNAFKEEDLDDKGYFAVDTKLRTFFYNDIYGNFECYPRPEINGVKTTIIYPATEKLIAKFTQQEVHIVLETPEIYEKLTLPHIEKDQFNFRWLYNILEGTSEQDRIVYDNKCEEEGFILLPDLKWDGITKETLYLLAIVRRRGIKSLRDLNETHLPLLKRIREEGKQVIYSKYKVPGSQLRIYFHYQPSFYHLHIHFTYLKHEAPGIYAEKSHLLDTVIDNIEMMGSYYQRATLPFTIREMDTIFNVFETNGHVERIKQCNEDKK